MAGIQLSGMASGMDTSAIIEKTMELERIPINSKQEDIEKVEEEKKVWKNIDNYLQTLESQGKDLTFSATFGARKVESSAESKVTATAQNNLSSATYTLENIKMAKAGKITSGAKIGAIGATGANVEKSINIADTTTPLNQLGYAISDGTININGSSIAISSTDSLELVMQKINESNAGVNATYDTDQQTIKFETKQTGSGQTISFNSDSSNFFMSTGMDDLLGQTIENGVDPDISNVLQSGEKAYTEGASTIVDPNARFGDTGTGITAGELKINGKTINVEETDTINLVINKINTANAGVNASFDKINNTFRLESTNVGSNHKIKLEEDTSGFLDAVGLGEDIGTTIENGVNSDYKRTLGEVAAFDNVAETGFFTVNGYTFEVDKSTDTLETVLDRINDSDAGVTLFYDEDNMQITTIAENAGEDIVLENDTAGFLGALNLMNQSGDSNSDLEASVYKGAKASVDINGVKFLKDSNKFVVNGVNIELKSNTSEGESIKLEVKADTEKAYTEVEEFINAYNDLIGYIEKNTEKEGILQGDSTANSMVYKLRREMTGRINGADSEYNQLALVGIEVADSKSSKLEIDSTKFKEALDTNPNAIRYLFTKNIGAGLITDESVGQGDGSSLSFNLEGVPENTDDMRIKVGDKEYTVDGGTYKIVTNNTEPGANEVYLDMMTGKMKFGTAPDSSALISADYNVDSSKTSDGLAIRVNTYLKPYTTYNGTMDSRIKSYDNKVKDMNNWIANVEMRLEKREESLRRQYTAMEEAINNSNSTGSWLSSQLSSLQA